MSREIDQKIVEMRFDNKHFESNVATSMSTLDKLKSKLSLKGLGKAAESEFGSYTSGFISFKDSINKMWASWEYDIANRMKSLAKSFTIDPLKTGFNEYELKMGSVQTIMASTGESLETVNQHLEELNKYSDQTIYSFSDMTQNIGKFTNAGVKLEDAVLAIKGISNEAALSGANANEAARAMYNFSQALSAGYVKLIDWKSIENANMATVGFKEELIKTAVELGTVTEAADGMYETLDGNTFNATKNFNEVLQDQWMTSEVLVKTLSKYADETTEIGKKATQAATEVKTFSMMMDTLREAAQSGWAQTWEIIFGDFNEGKALWTGLSNFFGEIIDNTSKARNEFLKGAFNPSTSSWDELVEKVNAAGIETNHFQNGLIEVARRHNIAIDDMIEKEGSFIATLKKGWLTSDIITETLDHFAGGSAKSAESTKNMTSALWKYQKVVGEVWFGKYKNAPDRQKLLTDAGYDYAVVQELVNKTEGKRIVTMQDLIETQGALSDAQLKNMGYTDEQIESIRELANEARKTGTPINELIENLSKKSGRELLLESLGRIGKSCIKIFKSLGQAWKEVFPPATSEQLYNVLAGFNKFSESLEMSDETADKLRRTFKGVFAALDIVLTLVAGPIKIAFKLFLAILKALDIPILDFTASIGDAIVAINDWLDKILDFDAAAKALIKFFNKTKEALFGWIEELKNSDNIPRDIILGIVMGIGKFAHLVVDSVINLGETMLTTIKKVLGIESPSKKFFQAAWYCILGFFNGIKEGIKYVCKVVKQFGLKVIETIKKTIKKIDFGQIIAAGIGVGAIVAALKLVKVFEAIVSPFESLGDLFEGLGKAAAGLGAKFRGEALLSMAKAVGILALSVLALAIAFKFLDPTDMWHAIGMIAALIGVLTLFSALLTKFSSIGATTISAGKGGLSINKKGFGSVIAQIGFTVLMIAFAIKLLSGLNPNKAKQAFIGAGVIVGAMLVFLAVLAMFGRWGNFADINKAGSLLTRMSIALIGLVLVAHMAKSLSKFNRNEIIAAGSFAAAALVLCAVITGFAKSSTKSTWQAGLVLLTLAWTLGQMVSVAKSAAQIGNMKPKEIWGAVGFAGAVIVLLGLLTVFADNESGSIMKAGITLAALAASIFLLARSAEILKSVGFGPAVGALVEFVILIAILGVIGKLVQGVDANIDKLGSLAIKLSITILLLTGIAFLLSFIPWKKALVGVGGVFLLLSGLALVLWAASAIKPEGIKDLNKTLVTLTVTIGLIGALVIALSFLNPKKVWSSVGALAVVLIALAGALVLMRFAKLDNNIFKNLIVMTVAIAAIGGALFLVGQLPIGRALVSAGALSIVLFALAGAMAIIGKIKMDASIFGSLIVMVAAIGIIGGIVYLVGTLPIENAITAFAGLGIVMAALALFMIALTKVSQSAMTLSSMIPMLITIAITIGILAVAIAMLSAIPIGQVTTSLLALAAGLVAITVVIMLLQNASGGMAALLAAAVAIAVFTISLSALASLDIGALWSAVGAITVVLAVLVGLGALVGFFPPIILGLLALGLAVALLGAGFLMAGGGMMLFANALSIMASVNVLAIGAGMIVLAAGLALLGVSCLGLIIAAPMIFLLAGALMTLGASSVLLIIAVPMIMLLATALASLASVNIASIPVSMAALAVALGGIGTAGLLLIIAVPLISKLAKSINTLSEAAPTAATGVKDLKSALSSLSKIKSVSLNLELKSIQKTMSKFAKSTKDIKSVSSAYAALASAMNSLAMAVLSLVAAYKALDALNTKNIGQEKASEFSKGARSANSAASSAGANLVVGFANGVRNNKHLARAAGNAVGQAAASGMRESLDIHSPSRVGEKLGGFTGLGFIKGLIKTQKSVYAASEDTGNVAIKGISRTISRIADAINTDIDTQPTIRPVLDLSDVKSGARTIGGMFPGRTVSVNTRQIGTIAASMAGYQNGNNSEEIVSGIKALRKDISEMPRNSYNINGITYDDGSNIASAVETLVRAARIERRV